LIKEMSKKKRIIIIGGGAAGMTAAIFASRNGAEVIILEQLPKVGRKILATGNGRCNLTNMDLDVSKYHGNNKKFAYGALARFGYEDTIEFFEDLGLNFVKEGSRIYPASLQASSVLDVLRYEMNRLGVEEVCDARVVGIIKGESGFSIKLKGDNKIYGDKVIVATGGKANPGLGSNGSGYDLVKPFGHKIINPFPAIVQMRLEADYLKSIAGVKVNANASIELDGKVLTEEYGEILFTNYGVSGPPVLQLSRNAGEAVLKGKKPIFNIDLFPGNNEEELLELLKKRCNLRPEKPLDFSFVGLINKRLINVLLREAKITNIKKPCSKVTDEELDRISNIIKKWPFKITGTNSWSEAVVTAGGVDVRDIDSKTMESRLVPGLYFAGEIMDIDGDCGGYNLQWAWSTGHLAGVNAAL